MPASNVIVDYSSYKDWMFCPWYWYERHVNNVEKINPFQRKDAMALGSLVHAGLEVWHRDGRIDIPASEVERIGPTSETLAQAQAALTEYVQRYPAEPWQAIAFEQPIVQQYEWGNLVAKLDAYTLIREPMQVPDGVNGGVINLVPGLYGIEHKTRDDAVEAAKFRKRWIVNMQASFQMLALQENNLWVPVQGIIVNVIDKPRPYVPKAKCNGCGETQDLSYWIPAGEQGYSCQQCGNVQMIKPKGPRTERKFEFWRMLVTRTAEELIKAEAEITQIAHKMQSCIEFGMDFDTPNREMCVHPIKYRECPYFGPHTYNYETVGHPDFKLVEDYLGI